jgi:hypothetical protein
MMVIINYDDDGFVEKKKKMMMVMMMVMAPWRMFNENHYRRRLGRKCVCKILHEPSQERNFLPRLSGWDLIPVALLAGSVTRHVKGSK